MKDDKKTVDTELSMDELTNVVGGISLQRWLDDVLHGGTDADGAGAGRTAGVATAAADGRLGAAAPGSRQAGAGTGVTAYCQTCGKKTEFTVFSGARGRCNVCGTIRTDL